MRSLKSQRETIIERIQAMQVSHSDPNIRMGMEIVKTQITQMIRDLPS